MNYIKAKSSTRVLAIDYGDSRIGLALSDIMHIIAKPYKTINNISDDSMIFKLSISHSGEYAMSVALMFNETHINTEAII